MAENGGRGGELPEFSEGTPIAVGTAIWLLLLVGALAAHRWLTDHDRGWWIWTAVAGLVLGGFGFLYLRRRRARLRASAQARAAP